MILIGSQEGYEDAVTKGKIYEHSGHTFLDDVGNTRSVAPHSWKVPKLSDVMIKISKPDLKDDDREEPMTAVQKLKEHAASLPTPPLRQEVIEASKCFGTQEDGSHYTDMQLQPLQACYLRYGLEGLRAAIHTKVDKYISRKKNDDIVQLKKANHCLSILVEIAEIEKELS